MNKTDLIGLRVAANPEYFSKGDMRLAGRRGTIVGFDESSHGFAIVELDLVGRERKKKRHTLPIHVFVELTERNDRILREWYASHT